MIDGFKLITILPITIIQWKVNNSHKYLIFRRALMEITFWRGFKNGRHQTCALPSHIRIDLLEQTDGDLLQHYE